MNPNPNPNPLSSTKKGKYENPDKVLILIKKPKTKILLTSNKTFFKSINESKT